MTLQSKLARLMALYRKRAVAEAAGVSAMTLSNVLSGKHQPTVKTVFGLARVLGVDPGWLLDDAKGWPPVRIHATEESAAHVA